VSASAGSCWLGWRVNGPGEGTGVGQGLGYGGGRKKKRETGWIGGLGRKQVFFPNSLKQIQIEFKLKEFEFEKNHKHFKQCKAAWMHNKQNIFVLFYKNNQSLFIFTKFPVKKSKCWKILKLLENCCFIFNFNHILKFKNFRV
jgi:hypothetical protein